MNVQYKNKKCNKINNELVQVVIVLGPLNMNYYFPPYCLLPRPVKFLKMPLCIPDFKIRIHVYYFGFYNPDNSYV